MLPAHNELLVQLYKCEPSRRDAKRYLDGLRGQVTAPPKGLLVGSYGTDWSFRLSKIPNDEFGRRGHFPTYKLLRNLIQPNTVRALVNGYRIQPGMIYADHATLDVTGVTAAGIRKWTKWANSNGVTHDGRFGYIFPRKRVWNTDAGVFDSMAMFGRRKTGERSDTARKRRKERRSLLQAVRKPQPVYSVPFEYRLERSQTSLRRTWFSMGSKRPTWSDFKLHTENKKVLSIGPVPWHRSQIPPLVALSLTRIYSRSVTYDIGPIKVLRSPPVEGRPPPWGGFTRSDLEKMLEEIELQGFHKTYEWFSLNHLLHEQFVENTQR